MHMPPIPAVVRVMRLLGMVRTVPKKMQAIAAHVHESLQIPGPREMR